MFFKQGALVERSLVTATGAGTLTLINTSETYQIFTGSTTHTLKLPDATTMPNGRRFEVVNASTGDITVQDSTAAVIGTVTAGISKIFRLADNSTAAGTFDITAASSGGAAALSAQDGSQFNAIAAKGFSPTSVVLKYNPEEIGGNFWTTKAPVSVAKAWPSNFTLNGFVYNAFGITNAPANATTNERYDTDLNYFLSRASGITACNTRAPFVLSGLAYVVNGDPSINAVERYDDVLNSWSARTAIGTAFYGAASWSLGSLGYIAGGQGSGTTTSSYEAVANVWSARAAVPISTTRVCQGGSEHNGFGHIVSGTSVTTVRRYDPALNSYSSLASSTVGHAHGGVASVSGVLLASGGENTSSVHITTVEKFYDGAGAWVTVAPISQARNGCGAVSGGLFMSISGGVGTGVAYTPVEAYTSNSLFTTAISLRSTTTPTAISASVIMNGLTQSVPVQIRSDKDNWKTIMSNGGSALKTGETLTTKFQHSPSAGLVGGANGLSSNESFNDIQNLWTLRASLSAVKAGGAGFTIDGTSYIAAGENGSADAFTNEQYKDLENTITARTAIPNTTALGASFGLNGFGYAVCGRIRSTLAVQTLNQQFNPTLNTWTNRTAATTSSRVFLPGTDLQGFGFIFSGYTNATGGGGSVITSSERYSDITNTWNTISSVGRENHTAFALNGFAYFTQGDSAPTGENNTYKYDPAASSFSLMSGGLNTARPSSPGSFRLNGYAYITGGSGNTSERFNVEGNTHTNMTNMNSSRQQMASPNNGPGAYRNYEMRVGIPAYYAGTGSYAWTTSPNTTVYPVNASAAVNLQGRGYRFGGFNGGGVADKRGEVYNETTDTSVTATSMSTDRYNLGSFALLGRGYFYQGVANPSGGQATAESINPETGTWTTITSTGVSITDTAQGAALNGFGYANGGGPSTSLTRYNQSLNTWTSATAAPASHLYCTFSIYGFIYQTSPTTATNTDRYNDASNAWTSSIAPLVTSINSNSAIVYQGVALSIHNTSCERFNDAANSWSIIATITTSGNSGGHFATGSTGYVLGGGSNTQTIQKLNSSLKQAVLSAGLNVS